MTTWKDYIEFIVKRGDIDELMILDSSDGSLWASSSETFSLKEYKTMIAQEDGTDKEETVNEASNIVSRFFTYYCTLFLKVMFSNQNFRLNLFRVANHHKVLELMGKNSK